MNFSSTVEPWANWDGQSLRKYETTNFIRSFRLFALFRIFLNEKLKESVKLNVLGKYILGKMEKRRIDIYVYFEDDSFEAVIRRNNDTGNVADSKYLEGNSTISERFRNN